MGTTPAGWRGGGGRRRGIEVLLMSKNDEVLDRVLRCSKHSAEM